MTRLKALLGRPAPPRFDLLRQEPISRSFGMERGVTIRRHYIERFLDAHRDDLTGRIVEIGDDRYARAYGTSVASIDVLDPAAPHASLRADLVTGEGVPEGAFDAAIVTQVLHVLPDMAAAVRHLAAALRPGGVLLATLPCITQVSRYDMDRWGDFWRVTDRGAHALFAPFFPASGLTVRAYGNHLAAVAALSGLAVEDVGAETLVPQDPDYQVLIGVRAVRAGPPA